jgi:hypothetical protein
VKLETCVKTRNGNIKRVFDFCEGFTEVSSYFEFNIQVPVYKISGY